MGMADGRSCGHRTPGKQCPLTPSRTLLCCAFLHILSWTWQHARMQAVGLELPHFTHEGTGNPTKIGPTSWFFYKLVTEPRFCYSYSISFFCISPLPQLFFLLTYLAWGDEYGWPGPVFTLQFDLNFPSSDDTLCASYCNSLLTALLDFVLCPIFQVHTEITVI